VFHSFGSEFRSATSPGGPGAFWLRREIFQGFSFPSHRFLGVPVFKRPREFTLSLDPPGDFPPSCFQTLGMTSRHLSSLNVFDRFARLRDTESKPSFVEHSLGPLFWVGVTLSPHDMIAPRPILKVHYRTVSVFVFQKAQEGLLSIANPCLVNFSGQRRTLLLDESFFAFRSKV